MREILQDGKNDEKCTENFLGASRRKCTENPKNEAADTKNFFWTFSKTVRQKTSVSIRAKTLIVFV